MRGVGKGAGVGFGGVGIEVSVEEGSADEGVGWDVGVVGVEGSVEAEGECFAGLDLMSGELAGEAGGVEEDFPAAVAVVGIAFGEEGGALPAHE